MCTPCFVRKVHERRGTRSTNYIFLEPKAEAEDAPVSVGDDAPVTVSDGTPLPADERDGSPLPPELIQEIHDLSRNIIV